MTNEITIRWDPDNWSYVSTWTDGRGPVEEDTHRTLGEAIYDLAALDDDVVGAVEIVSFKHYLDRALWEVLTTNALWMLGDIDQDLLRTAGNNRRECPVFPGVRKFYSYCVIRCLKN